MPGISPPPLVVRDSGTIRDSFLRNVRNGFLQRGLPDPNVTPTSDLYLIGQAIGNQLAVTEANGAVRADQVLPDTATGTDLARLAGIYALAATAAQGAVGNLIFNTAATTPTNIAAGQTLIDGAGLVYQVTTTGNYNNADLIPVQALTTGAVTNHAAGDILRWSSAPAGANQNIVVAAGGLINGTDAGNDESLRALLLAKLQNAPASGNSQFIVQLLEAASNVVQMGFVWPALQGAGSVHAAAVVAATATNKSRAISPSILTGAVIPYVTANLPEHVATTITGTIDVPTDVAFGLVLPEAPGANPPGPGGGWKNSAPWPTVDAATTFNVQVTAVASSTNITVNAQTAPQAGVSRISFLSSTTWTVFEANVLSYTGTAGAYVLSLDAPLPGIAAGNFIWPACQNSQTYANSVLAAYALMGPGEKTTNVSALFRGFRRPRPATSWPYTLGGQLTLAITSNAPQNEVSSAQFFYRYDGTTTLTGPSGLVTPQVPSVVTNAPNIYIPRSLGFYRVPG